MKMVSGFTPRPWERLRWWDDGEVIVKWWDCERTRRSVKVAELVFFFTPFFLSIGA
ncbi:hypothetical protein LINGRAHAP2_LOCUS30675, partial [Linum grandiflorum]